MDEELIEAEHDLGLVVDSLRAATHRATAVEKLVLAPVVKAAVDARNTVIVLREARRMGSAS